MRLKRLSVAVAISLLPGLAAAQSTAWQIYVVAETGAKVDIPVTVFSEDAGKPDAGYGRPEHNGIVLERQLPFDALLSRERMHHPYGAHSFRHLRRA